jgi:hypothetical protein
MNQRKKLKGKSVTDKTMNYELVINVIDEQYGNITLRHFKKDGSYRQITAVLNSFARKICGMIMQYDLPAPASRRDWQQNHANAVSRILVTPEFVLVVDNTIAEMKRRFPKAVYALPKYSFYKIASHAAQVANVIRYKKHPDILRAY